MAAVCVFCGSSERIDPRYIVLAEQLGARLAKDGHTLVSGGARISMMGAVVRAARAGGARTVGVMPQALIDIEIGDFDSDELVIVDSMRERKRIMDSRADVFVVLPGGIGTLEELFEVWTAGSIGLHSKPVFVLDPDGFYRPLWTYLESLVDAGFVRLAALEYLRRVSTVDELFTALQASADPSGGIPQHNRPGG